MNEIYTIPAYLRLTFQLLVENPNKLKTVNNIRTLFECLDTVKMEIPEDSRVLIEMIQKAIQAVDIGLKDKDAIYTYSVHYADHPDVIMIKESLQETMSNDLQNMMNDYLSSLILNRPIYAKAERFADLAIAVKGKGIKQSMAAMDAFVKEVEDVKKQLDDIRASKVTDELYVEDEYDIGLDMVAQQRDDENGIVLRLFGAMNKLTGGGSRLRKSNLIIANTGCFKSGLLLNIALYIKEYAELPEDFLDGMDAAVLYITHENTLAQTATRILAWYGYTKTEIDRMSRMQFKKTLNECLRPKANGVRIIIKYIDPDTITMQDIDSMIEDLSSANKKIIACCEDYIKHILPNMRDDQVANNVQSGDVIAIQASALARKRFLSFWTASQFGREAQKIKDEAKEKGADYLKKLNTSHMAGAFNATNSYESIFIIDRGSIPGTGESFLAIKIVKDRDDRNDGESDYYVVPFDKGNFKLSDDKYYTSVAEMNPALAALTDIYNTALLEIDMESKKAIALETAKKELSKIGFLESDISSMGEVDILERAKHLSEGAMMATPSTMTMSL